MTDDALPTVPTPKFAIGDSVFSAEMTLQSRMRPCPDCLGTKHWKTTSPAGTEYEFPCPRCSSAYMNDRDLSLAYSRYEPAVRRLTIKTVRIDSGDCARPVSYMCHESSVHDEERLFATEDEAMEAARRLCLRANANTEHVIRRFDKALRISDYQLGNAALALAKDRDISLRVDIQNLFDDLRYAIGQDDVEAVRKTIDEFEFRSN